MPQGHHTPPRTSTRTKRRTAKAIVDAAGALDLVQNDGLRENRMGELRAQAAAVGISLYSFEVTHEPMLDPDIEALSGPDQARIETISHRMYDDPASQYDELVALVADHPGIPILRNHLAGALAARGEHDRAHELVEETTRLFPDYIFAFANHVMVLLADGEIDRARAIMEEGPRGPMLFIGAFAPTRTRFHSTEIVCYESMIGHYLVATDRLEAAKTSLEMITGILPEHPQIQSLAERIENAELALLLKRTLESLAARRRKTAGKKKGQGKKGQGKKSRKSGV